MKAYSGSCLCGKIRFRVSGFSQQVANCHCRMCQKFHGAAFATLVAVTDLRWLSGEQLLTEYQADNGTIRSFCCDCGSSLGFRSIGKTAAETEIAIACFDEDIPVVVDAHIYVDSKAKWHHIDGHIPQYPRQRNPDNRI